MDDVTTLRYPGAPAQDGIARETYWEYCRRIDLPGCPWQYYSVNELQYERATLIDQDWLDTSERPFSERLVRIFEYRFPYSRSIRGQIHHKIGRAIHVPLPAARKEE